jgi:hypothetical protein
MTYNATATVDIKCPDCEELIPVTITVNLTPPDEDGVVRIYADEPDTTDIYAHWLTHGGAA